MSNRSANFASALFATVLAGANFATTTNIRAQTAADTCLTAPKDKTPAGSHWYYRLERGTKRQCWYLRDEDDKTTRAAPQETQEPQETSAAAASPSPAADPVPPQPRPAVRKSIANAHAELPSSQARAGQDSNAPVEPQTTGVATGARIPNNTADTATKSSPVATRWLDSSGVNPPGNLRTAAAEPPVTPPENDPAVSQPVAPPVVPAAVDSSMAKQSASMQMLFLVMAGALAMAGIMASLIFRFGRKRARRPEIRRDRRAIWDSIHAERSSPSMLPGQDMPIWRNADEHDPRAPDDPERRVTEMLSRLARSAQH